MLCPYASLWRGCRCKLEKNRASKRAFFCHILTPFVWYFLFVYPIRLGVKAFPSPLCQEGLLCQLSFPRQQLYFFSNAGVRQYSPLTLKCCKHPSSAQNLPTSQAMPPPQTPTPSSQFVPRSTLRCEEPHPRIYENTHTQRVCEARSFCFFQNLIIFPEFQTHPTPHILDCHTRLPHPTHTATPPLGNIHATFIRSFHGRPGSFPARVAPWWAVELGNPTEAGTHGAACLREG